MNRAFQNLLARCAASGLVGFVAQAVGSPLPPPETQVYKKVGNLEIKADIHRVTGHDGPRPVMVYLLGEWQMRPSTHPTHYEDSNLAESEAWKQVSGPPIANVRDRKGDGGAFNDFIRRTARWPKAISGWDPVTEAEKYTPCLPLRNVTSTYPPTFMIHGVEHRLVRVPGAEHGLKGCASDLIASIEEEAAAFLRSHLMPATTDPGLRCPPAP